MFVGREVKELQQFDWWRARVWPLGLHTSAQSPKVKGLQNAYMISTFLVLLALGKNLGMLKMKTQILVKRSNLFSIKYSKSDKKALMIYFSGLCPLALQRSLNYDLSTWTV